MRKSQHSHKVSKRGIGFHLIWVSLVAATSLSGCGGSGGSVSLPTCSPDAYTPNYATTSGLTLRRWSSLPIRIYFKTSTPIGSTTVEQYCRQGFDQWESKMGRDFWVEVGLASAADMTVEVKTTAPQSTLALTTVFFTQGSNIITRAEMVVNTWASLPETGYAGTATHELGHGLGLGGHSQNPLDIMYFTGNASDLLTTRDVNTLRTAYCDFGTNGKTLPPSRSKEGLLSETIVCDLNDLHSR